MTGEQIRAARALARMEQTALATAADVSVETVKRLERVKGVIVSMNIKTDAAIRKAFEAAGVIFIDGDAEHGPGVRLKHPIAAV